MHVKYLADTCILSETSRSKPHPGVKRWLTITRYVALPVGALVEFEQGIAMREQDNPRKFAELSQWRDDLITSGISFVDTDLRVALQYGRMRACPELKNLWYPKPELEIQRGGQDIHIAAAAIVNGYVVATANVDDFMLIHRHFPLPGLYNPKEDAWHVMPKGIAHESRDTFPVPGRASG